MYYITVFHKYYSFLNTHNLSSRGLLCNYICQTQTENTSAILNWHKGSPEDASRRVEKPKMKIIKTVIQEQDFRT